MFGIQVRKATAKTRVLAVTACTLVKVPGEICPLHLLEDVKGKGGKAHPCTGTEALYRPYGL